MQKDDILKEIVRTAKENNGRPLGRDKFAKETGIQIGDWQGKYWARWSDAVIEAGCTPNKMRTAYNFDWLMGQIIPFFKDIKKFPTVTEFDLKAHNTPGFPTYNTIRQRIGTQSQLAQQLIDYCKNRPEYSDIIELCNNIPLAPEAKPTNITRETTEVRGYVYLLKSGRFYKIGRSGNVGRRSYDIGIKLPEPTKILHKIVTDDPIGIEQYWHNRFKDKNKNGEWFDLSPEDIRAFKRRTFQ